MSSSGLILIDPARVGLVWMRLGVDEVHPAGPVMDNDSTGALISSRGDAEVN
jgi:hypothetical protein